MKNIPIRNKGIIFLILIIFVFTTCKKDDSKSLNIKAGYWIGTDIAFTVNKNPMRINNLEFTYRGHVSNGGCSFDYESGESYAFFTELKSLSFTGDTNIFDITGTFTSDTTAELTIGWEDYDSNCDVSYSGSKDYTAKYSLIGK